MDSAVPWRITFHEHFAVRHRIPIEGSEENAKYVRYVTKGL